METNDSQSYILEKVRRLMRLGASSNEHEAENAAAAAQRLIDLHRIDPSLVGDPWAVESEPAAEPTTNAHRGDMGQTDVGPAGRPWTWSLLWGVCKANGCRPWREWRGGEMRDTVIGRAHDRAAAEPMYAFLRYEIERLARGQRGQKRGRSWISAFRYGIADAVTKRLETSADLARGEARAIAAQASPGALARVERGITLARKAGDETDIFMRSTGRRYSKGRGGGPSDVDGYLAGTKVGSAMSLGGGRRSLGGG